MSILFLNPFLMSLMSLCPVSPRFAGKKPML